MDNPRDIFVDVLKEKIRNGKDIYDVIWFDVLDRDDYSEIIDELFKYERELS